MGSFDDRKKSLENKFFHDEDMKFRIISRRRKLLGLWAAEKMHLSDEDSLKYALDIVQFGVKDNTEGAVVNKIMGDIQAAGIAVTEEEVRATMVHVEEIARKQFLPDA